MRLQLGAEMHFLLENPAGSSIFDLECFREVWESGRVVAINMPQCALGLVVERQPIYKKHYTLGLYYSIA